MVIVIITITFRMMNMRIGIQLFERNVSSCKNDGAIFYNHKWRVQDGLLQNRQDIIRDLSVRQIIIWRRKGGINFNPGFFLPTYEIIYLIPKPDFKLAPKANAYGDVWEFTQEMNNPHPALFLLIL